MEEFTRDSYSNVSEDIHKIEVPEHVEIGFTLAGFGSRFIAYLIDLACMILFVALLFAAMITLLIVAQRGAFESFMKTPNPQAEGFLIAIVVSVFGLSLFVVSWFYFVIFEMLLDGKSPGKKALRIRVICDEGGKISFYTSLLRNLMRVADWLPAFYLVGIIAMFVNKKWKRLGDLVAGTIVVKEEKAGWLPSASMPPPARSHVAGEERLESVLTDQVLEKLGRDYFNLCFRYLKRREQIDPYKAYEISRSIAMPVIEKLGIVEMQPDRFIEAFAAIWQEKKGFYARKS